MSTEVPEILLAHYLKTLKLPTFQALSARSWDFGQVEERLVNVRV
ncbi:hypothetical protein SFHH103_03368 [Sinorhizobium fredii HH103]|uniref:Uncharacterized protein n=1 Tax=Sinorhizobium fredii (strain HH103) TaxID=1117943 RepID=G9A3B2_SINF1|nr:hypothetical protein [Sinorhizobium fredii]CCE97860.1 hypothetical protein SFHH103_03368 [Sinorhizobium fredii HH103]